MKSVLTTLVLLVGVMTLGSPAMAGSTVLHVTKTADTNDGACTQSDCSLREAIIQANTSGADEIEVPAGTYELTIAGRDEDAAATGDLDIRTSVTIRGAGARSTTIDGNGLDRVFHTPAWGMQKFFGIGINEMTITGGDAGTSVGGGIFHQTWDASMNVYGSTVRSNTANQGGGVANSDPSFESTMAIRSSTVSKNTATIGGGVQNSNGDLTLANSTVSGNSSERYGGGVTLVDGTATIANSTIAFNKAKEPGGGVDVSRTNTTFKNTIVASNKSIADSGANCNDPEDKGTSTGNNLENGKTCGFDQSSDIKAKKPMLGKLVDNGGPTNTHALIKGSPAIDAGDNAACAAPPIFNLDQRNKPRPRDGDRDGPATCDIGAYER